MTRPSILDQRDQALACMILALCITLAVFFSVFGEHERMAIENAKKMAALHETLLRQSSDVLRQNQEALNMARTAFERIHRDQQPR